MFVFENFKKFESSLRKQKKENRKLKALYDHWKEIDSNIQRALGEKPKIIDQSGKAMLEEDTVDVDNTPFMMQEFEALIQPDDQKVTIETYLKIIWKFYAAIRYQIY